MTVSALVAVCTPTALYKSSCLHYMYIILQRHLFRKTPFACSTFICSSPKNNVRIVEDLSYDWISLQVGVQMSDDYGRGLLLRII